MLSHTVGYANELVGGPCGGAEGAAVVGTWAWTAETGCYVLDRGAAEFLTGNPDLAGAHLSLDAVTQCFHPADRGRLRSAIERAVGDGGPVAAAYRIHRPAGTIRLMAHGRIYPGTPGMPAHGHGVLIDVTQRRSRGLDAEAGTPLERAAKHALASRRAIDEDGSESLRLLIDMVLLEIGRVIARRVGEDRAEGVN